MAAFSDTRRRAGVPTAAALLGLALVASAACGLDISMRAEARDEWKRSYKVAPKASVEIHNTNGRIHIQPSDGDTVDVTATRIVKASNDNAAKTALADFKIAETVTPELVRLDSSVQGFGLGIGVSRTVDYEVRLPKWVNVGLKATNGDIDVNGVAGMFRAETTNGKVVATGLEQGATVESTNGLIRLEFTRLGENGVTCETTNGEILVTVPRDAKARVSARVTNGAITTSDLNLTVSDQSRRRLEATIGGGGPTIRLETTNGHIGIKGR